MEQAPSSWEEPGEERVSVSCTKVKDGTFGEREKGWAHGAALLPLTAAGPAATRLPVKNIAIKNCGKKFQ